MNKYSLCVLSFLIIGVCLLLPEAIFADDSEDSDLMSYDILVDPNGGATPCTSGEFATKITIGFLEGKLYDSYFHKVNKPELLSSKTATYCIRPGETISSAKLARLKQYRGEIDVPRDLPFFSQNYPTLGKRGTFRFSISHGTPKFVAYQACCTEKRLCDSRILWGENCPDGTTSAGRGTACSSCRKMKRPTPSSKVPEDQQIRGCCHERQCTDMEPGMCALYGGRPFDEARSCTGSIDSSCMKVLGACQVGSACHDSLTEPECMRFYSKSKKLRYLGDGSQCPKAIEEPEATPEEEIQEKEVEEKEETGACRLPCAFSKEFYCVNALQKICEREGGRFTADTGCSDDARSLLQSCPPSQCDRLIGAWSWNKTGRIITLDTRRKAASFTLNASTGSLTITQFGDFQCRIDPDTKELQASIYWVGPSGDYQQEQVFLSKEFKKPALCKYSSRTDCATPASLSEDLASHLEKLRVTKDPIPYIPRTLPKADTTQKNVARGKESCLIKSGYMVTNEDEAEFNVLRSTEKDKDGLRVYYFTIASRIKGNYGPPDKYNYNHYIEAAREDAAQISKRGKYNMSFTLEKRGDKKAFCSYLKSKCKIDTQGAALLGTLCAQ